MYFYYQNSAFTVLHHITDLTKQSVAELESQQVKWTQISKAAVALVAVCTIYSFATVEHAPPPHHVYSYMHQRKKKFPWGDGNTPIFGETPIDVIARGGEVEHHH